MFWWFCMCASCSIGSYLVVVSFCSDLPKINHNCVISCKIKSIKNTKGENMINTTTLIQRSAGVDHFVVFYHSAREHRVYFFSPLPLGVRPLNWCNLISNSIPGNPYFTCNPLDEQGDISQKQFRQSYAPFACHFLAFGFFDSWNFIPIEWV